MADISSTAKAAAHDGKPARRLTGDALLQSEDFVPFVLECFGRAVRRAAANGDAAVMPTQYDA
jgi:hypothetical protein